MTESTVDDSGSPTLDDPARPGRALVTGATGYIGSQLVPALLTRGWDVRILTRSRGSADRRPWAGDVEVVEGNADSPDDLRRALDGVDVAYYLLHSMEGAGDFVTRDREIATTFAAAARAAGTRRLVYLGGLHPEGDLSPHLGSRVEVGEILLASGVPTVVLQAGVVLGDGSASFDMLRHLTERLPAMIAPKWLRNRIQPIAIDDVVHYLAGAALLPADVNRTFDIGGPEVLTYADMMKRYARICGLGRRPILTLPLLTPSLASHWVGLVTPVLAGVARPLVGSLIHDAVCDDDDVLDVLGEPPGGRTPSDVAVERATGNLDAHLWRRTLAQLAGMVAVCAVAGSLFTDPDSWWYRTLSRPGWEPPSVAFPVVWTSLYAALTVTSAATITELTEQGRVADAGRYRKALLGNLVLNTAWSALFWRARRPWLATLDSAALAVSSIDLARRAGTVGRGKRAVLLGYAGWCGFATVLGGSIARRNQARKR
jgi:uncharacterized protein YbjT (DUF2867 family)/tryptophan-rich sensory protein